MLRELLSIFRKDDPLGAMGEDFTTMLERSRELTLEAGQVYFGPPVDAEELRRISKRDVKVNKLQRKIRKRVITHLSVQGNSPDLPYCLLLMSLVKDVERIGDYAKDLSEIRQFGPEVLPDDESVRELQGIRSLLEATLTATSEVFANSDRERAVELIRQGRELLDRCDALLRAVADQQRNAGAHTALILGIQYYKRIAGHVLNVLSSVVVPLHRLDYYDEKDISVQAAD